MITETRYFDIANSILDEVFETVAEAEAVPVKLLRAICWAETEHNAAGYNHNDGGSGKDHAFGACQVLHSTARDMGFKDDNCYRDFRKSKTRNYYDCKLFGPRTGVVYGARYLKKKLDQYGGDWEKAAAAYNTGTVIICKTGVLRRKKDGKIIARCKVGDFANRYYLDKVNLAIEENR